MRLPRLKTNLNSQRNQYLQFKMRAGQEMHW